MKPILQVALDFVDLSRAMKCAGESAMGGIDWLEAGTPLIKSEGLNAIRKLREKFPTKTIVADMKIMDAGRTEVEIAAKSGANIVCVLGAASDATIKECVDAAHNYGAKIQVDLIAIKDVKKRAIEVEKLGVDYIGVHCPIDDQMRGKDPFRELKDIARHITIPIAVAGGINSETAADAVKAGASIIIVGGAINKSKDAKKATEDIKRSINQLKKIKTILFKRGSEKDIAKILMKISTSNLSDAMHRQGALKDLISVNPGLKMCGQALTVRTYPGDWAKPVEAIEIAEEGQVIVIDAGGVGPAIWGELATHGAIQKKLAGVVIDGAIRDVKEIRSLKFPAFARIISPSAGEPKGFGEIGVSVNAGGVKVFSGDWILGDDDGVVVIPKNRAVEFANRAMSVMETENRLRKEIDEGSTLSKVIELLKWEKK
ncbi:MAG: bifunctional hexulose-6-phosphate synthase/ribonuclease regulator [Candidatus Omnitrophica bacterium CG22_combo_CG10-13_8_21_14_all_43_16]|nr:MAG: bifunctional hexulose-6-phosphate synthase/ribonuclease regulator [Candidatus Omnitrophica bacterium CG22_combo_CG10-13_8_21_14_all_43_16]